MKLQICLGMILATAGAAMAQGWSGSHYADHGFHGVYRGGGHYTGGIGFEVGIGAPVVGYYGPPVYVAPAYVAPAPVVGIDLGIGFGGWHRNPVARWHRGWRR